MQPREPSDPPHGATQDRFFTAPLILIFVTVFIDLVGFGMVIPILPFYAERFQATPFAIGMLFAAYSWMQFFFSPVLGRLSDHFGRRPVLFLSLVGSAVGYLVMGVAGTLALVFAGRIIGGITGGNISTAQAYIADVTSRENRAKGMGLFGAAFGLGFILGPAIAGVLSRFDVRLPFYVAAGLSALSAAGVFFLLPETVQKVRPAEGEQRPNRFLELVLSFRDAAFGLLNLIYFLLISSFSIMTYAFVLYTAYRFGYTAEQNGYLFAFVGLVSIVGQGMLFGTLAKRFGEVALVMAGCVSMAISLFAIPYISPMAGQLPGLLAACVLLSFGNAMASPALTALVSKITAEEKQGHALGIFQSAGSLARAVGPTVGGILLNNAVDQIDEWTLFRTFWTASAIMLVALAAAIFSRGAIHREQLR